MSLGNIHTRYANINININRFIPRYVCPSSQDMYVPLGNIHTRYANINININRFIPRYVCPSVIFTLDMQI